MKWRPYEYQDPKEIINVNTSAVGGFYDVAHPLALSPKR